MLSRAGREFVLEAVGVCLLGRSTRRVQLAIRAARRQGLSALQLHRVWYVHKSPDNVCYLQKSKTIIAGIITTCKPGNYKTYTQFMIIGKENV